MDDAESRGMQRSKARNEMKKRAEQGRAGQSRAVRRMRAAYSAVQMKICRSKKRMRRIGIRESEYATG